jgi:hypothetical protein
LRQEKSSVEDLREDTPRFGGDGQGRLGRTYHGASKVPMVKTSRTSESESEHSSIVPLSPMEHVLVLGRLKAE